MTGLNTISDAPAKAASARIHQLTHHSSMRENILMHLLLAQLGLELTKRGVDMTNCAARSTARASTCCSRPAASPGTSR